MKADCPECGQECPAWMSTEGEAFVDCPSPECEPCGSTFPVCITALKPRQTLSSIMIDLQREAVENAMGGTQEGFEPDLEDSLSMMLDSEFFYEGSIQETMAKHLKAVLS